MTTPIEAAIKDERRRILQILEAHKSWVDERCYQRLVNLINSDIDLEEEMGLPPEERAGGFTWPDTE